MGGEIGRDITTIALAIVGVAVLAVLVSRNANTQGVLGTAAGGFSSALATAEGPVTGYMPPPVMGGYGMGGYGMGMGMGGFGGPGGGVSIGAWGAGG